MKVLDILALGFILCMCRFQEPSTVRPPSFEALFTRNVWVKRQESMTTSDGVHTCKPALSLCPKSRSEMWRQQLVLGEFD